MTHIETLKLALEYLQDNQHLIADNERHAYVMEYNAFIERFEKVIEQAELVQRAEEAFARSEQAEEQEPVVDRENSIIRFALHQFMSNAYSHMNAAAQDKDGRRYPPEAVEKFAEDAKDAEALLSRLQFTTPPPRQPLTNGEIYTAYITATNQTLRAQDERLAFAFARAIEVAHGIKEKNT